MREAVEHQIHDILAAREAQDLVEFFAMLRKLYMAAIEAGWSSEQAVQVAFKSLAHAAELDRQWQDRPTPPDDLPNAPEEA